MGNQVLVDNGVCVRVDLSSSPSLVRIQMAVRLIAQFRTGPEA